MCIDIYIYTYIRCGIMIILSLFQYKFTSISSYAPSLSPGPPIVEVLYGDHTHLPVSEDFGVYVYDAAQEWGEVPALLDCFRL